MKQLRWLFLPVVFAAIVACRGQDKTVSGQGGAETPKDTMRQLIASRNPARIGMYEVPVTLHNAKGNWERDELFGWAEPLKGTNDKLMIVEIQPQVLVYLEWYDHKTRSYLRGDAKGTALVVTKLEFYGDDGVSVKTYDINKQSPYTLQKYPNIEHEHYYDGEIGFVDKEDRAIEHSGRAGRYWTDVDLLPFPQNNYVGLVYHLYGLGDQGGILFDKNTLRMFDHTGKLVFEVKDSYETIVGALVTPDGRYAVVNIGGEQDINNMSDKLSPEGFIVYEIVSGKEIYREYGENSNVSIENAYMVGDYVRINAVDQKRFDEDYRGKTILLDIDKRLMYRRDFKESEIQNVIGDMQYKSDKDYLEFLFKTFKFETIKF